MTEEFVILLGEEDVDKPVKPSAAKDNKSDSAKEFVILLDEPSTELPSKTPVSEEKGDNGEFVILLGEEEAAPDDSQVSSADLTLRKNENIEHSAELKSKLVKLTALGQDIAVDCSKVEHIDTSALQLLVAGTFEQQNHGNKLSIVNASESFKSSAKILDLERHLDVA